jgi:iron(III) transport system substrate-binding protein
MNGLPRIFVAALIGFAAASSAHAQDWKAEWDKTVAAAKQEGELWLAAPINPIVQRFVAKAWPEAWPDIKLKATPTFGAWPTRTQEERKIGKYLYDAYLSGVGPAVYDASGELFDPLPPALILPDIKNPETWGGWDEAFGDRHHDRLLSFATFTGTIWYNASEVPRAEADRLGFKVLLDPKYKGKIAWWDPRLPQTAGATYAHLIYKVEGWETLKKIIVDQESVFYSDAQAATEAVVRGKSVFALGANLDNRLEQFRKAGINIDIRPLGRTPQTAHLAYGGTSIAIMSKPVHPNAAKLFVNWFLTKEVQAKLLPELRHNSRRKDMPIFTDEWIAAIPGAHYVALQADDVTAERSKVVEMIRQLRP